MAWTCFENFMFHDERYAKVRVASYELPVASCELLAARCKLVGASCELITASRSK